MGVFTIPRQSICITLFCILCIQPSPVRPPDPDRAGLSALPSPRRSSGLAGLVLAGAFLASAVTFLGVRRMVAARVGHRFDMAADDARERLSLEVRHGTDLLRGLRGLAQTLGGMDRDRLDTFPRSMDGRHLYSGLHGITYTVPVPPGDRARLIQAGGSDLPTGIWHALAPRGFTGQRHLWFGQRAWRLELSAGPGFFLPQEAALPWLSAAACMIVGSLLAGLLHSLARTGARAQELAGRMTGQLHASRARLQAIVQVVPDLLLVYDRDGRYLEVLTQDPTHLVAPLERLADRTVTQVMPPAQAHLVLSTIRRALDEGRELSVHYTLTTLRGERRFEARAIPLEPGYDDQPAVLWVARDITEREDQEAALRQAQKLESVGLLAGGIAHDFNNLLTAIQGHLCLGRLALAEDRDPARHLDRVEATIALAADLARQLLAYSGRTPLTMQPLDLNVLLRDLSALLGVSHARQVDLELDLAADLPPVQGDRVQVQQVVLNLVTNASEAIGDRPGHIRLATRSGCLDAPGLAQRLPGQGLEPGPHVTLTVTDDGCGMDAELLARIFDPFFTTKQSGRGLGLSALRGILRAHRAGLEVGSRVGQGTTMTVHFPALAATDPQAAVEPAERVRTGTGGLVLLAEDEASIRELATQMLERLGFQVLAGEDGEAGWDLYRQHQKEIRAVILDLGAARRGGADLYDRIRACDPGLPILLCSGYSREGQPEPPRPGEPRGFLEKPFTFGRLDAALRDLLGEASIEPTGAL
jgi:PAS domain S-box-containing protein